ncbi:MAG TPA: hypothetical protein VFR33_14740 [Candidatus Dormibacteraeota bacterium]|nr:hypothetical protein [Candidatus Dormibacteraeota bacterium]
MAASTLLQLVEAVAGAIIVLIGALTRSGPLTLVGGGFLMGLAIANILAPEGGSIYRRSFIGYVIAAVFVLVGLILYHLAA